MIPPNLRVAKMCNSCGSNKYALFGNKQYCQDYDTNVSSFQVCDGWRELTIDTKQLQPKESE